MKLAVIYTGSLPNTYANSINTVKHADAFYSLGHDVTIFQISSVRNPSRHIHRFYDINPSIKIIGVRETKFFDKKSFFPTVIHRLLDIITIHRIRYINDAQKKIAKLISDNDFDLVYARSFRAPYYLVKYGVNTIIETHAPKVKNPQLKRLLKLSKNKYFKGISTISQILKDNFVKYGVPPEKNLVQEDAVDIKKFDDIHSSKEELRKELKLPDDKIIITYSGSLKSGKGIKHLIDVAARFKHNKDIIFLMIGGPDENIQTYKNYANEKAAENIIFKGFIYQKEIPGYLKTSDILIMLYSKHEKKTVMDMNTTSPIKLFEYCAAKVPIIASSVPTISKVITHNIHALMQEPDDIDAVKNNILRLLSEKELRQELTTNAYKIAEENTYRKRCEKILEEWQI